MDDYKLIQELEYELLTEETRNNRERLSVILDDSYEEIGRSGKIYNKQDAIDSLSIADAVNYTLSDFEYRTLCEGCVLVKYKSNSDGVISLRSSIWKNDDSNWRILYHQASVTEI